MFSKLIPILLVLVVLPSLGFRTATDQWMTQQGKGYQLFYQETDKENIAEYASIIDEAIGEVESFSSDVFRQRFNVYVHPNRASLDLQWQKDWGMPDFKSECWMVASGTGTKIDMISPKKWDTESCEHSYANLAKTKQLILHELFHVYHGQLNVSSDFSDVTGLDWLLEGFATFASGQCDQKRIDEVKKALEGRIAPSELDNFWKGKLKYGLSGSVLMYLDQKYGRSKVLDLLKYNRKEQVMAALQTTELELLAGWKSFILAYPNQP